MSDWSKYLEADLDEERADTWLRAIDARLDGLPPRKRRLPILWLGFGLLAGSGVAFASWTAWDAPEPEIKPKPTVEPVAPATPPSAVEDPPIEPSPPAIDVATQRKVSTQSKTPPVERVDPFLEAATLRREGLHREAAAAYERFLRQKPKDARAGIAAFQLGLLYADHLNQPRQAIESLERAERIGADPLWEEELLARLAQSYAAIGDEVACGRRHADYVDRYPEGNYLQPLSEACSLR